MSFEAFIEFGQRLEEVRALQALDPVAIGSLPLTREAALADAAVNRASIVLMCGHLEGFVEHLLAEALDVLLATPLPQQRISSRLRHRHGLHAIRGLDLFSHPDDFAEKFTDMIARNQNLFAANTVSRGDIDTELLQRGFADPKPAKIVALYGIFGISKRDMIAAFGSYRLSQAVTVRVDSLVSIRHEIAHGGTLQATRADVVGYLAAVRLFGGRLDLAVARQVEILRAGPGNQRDGYFERRKTR